MKIRYIILLFTLFTVNVFAQTKDEKIETLKIAYITEKLNLSKTEAQNFWQIYNTFEEKNDAIRDEMRARRKNTDLDALSEAEAKKLLSDMMKSNDERHQLFNKYMADLKSVLPAKKIIILKKTEEEFRRKMLEEYKKRHQNDKK
ncbi:sensor of ECF-type sigma factor [Formosa sp. 3Alg 14/1]|uniref:sensor of ECF-type sigma factor n=1 Tax=Formosa sp. 3Alg 14/1 TaxID=3382190 RepID=UPI0039BDF1F8